MPQIEIRQCKRSDADGIMNVCYKTGYMGEDLTGKNLFNDARLFGYLFCSYYPVYEPHNCFVAVDKDDRDRIVGYIIGTDNSKRQKRSYAYRMVWKIILRLLLHTLFRYPESLKTLVFFSKSARMKDEPESLYEEYPAHLHINILEQYQHMGLGSGLMRKFEEHIKEAGAKGIHLKTSNQNYKAIPFYIKKGYKIIQEEEHSLWRGVDDYKSIIFAKKI